MPVWCMQDGKSPAQLLHWLLFWLLHQLHTNLPFFSLETSLTCFLPSFFHARSASPGSATPSFLRSASMRSDGSGPIAMSPLGERLRPDGKVNRVLDSKSFLSCPSVTYMCRKATLHSLLMDEPRSRKGPINLQIDWTFDLYIQYIDGFTIDRWMVYDRKTFYMVRRDAVETLDSRSELSTPLCVRKLKSHPQVFETHFTSVGAPCSSHS